jgi:putative spermidine/putrescine transport system substrate-binding protein
MLSRKAFLKTSAGAAMTAPGVLGACSPGGGQGSGRRLNVMMNGGVYEALARQHIIEPFEAEFGVAVNVIPGTAAQILTRLMAERSNPAVDVVILDQMLAARGISEGLFERIDSTNIPNLVDLEEVAVDSDGFGPIVHSHSLALGINTELLDVDPPTGWMDLWHPRFAGMVTPASIELTPGVLFLVQSSLQNGGSYENMDPGFEAIARLEPNFRKFYRGIGEIRPLLNSENVIVVVSSNVTQGEVDKGNPIGVIFPEEGSLASPAVAQVVRGTEVKELAERFIDQYLRPEVQLQWVENFYLTVFNKRVEIPEQLRARVADKVVFFDSREIAQRREAWVDRWVREIRL